MNDARLQHLAGAFNSIIAMMLATIRARGLRGLIDLPKMILVGLYLRRLGKEFAALIASLDLGALPPPTPAPPDRQAAPAQPAPAARARPRLVVLPDVPAQAAGADRARQAAAQPVSAAPRTTARRTRISRATRHRAFARPRHAPDPRAILGLPASLRDPGRTSCERHRQKRPTCVQFVTK
jgi:hypothetical protein